MANNFSDDSNCVALYNLESGALGIDSKQSHDLINLDITADEVNFEQGSASGNSNASSSRYLRRTDASLAADFPGKNGTANRTLSIAGWIRPTTLSGAFTYIVTKWSSVSNKRSFGVLLTEDTGDHNLSFYIGHTGGASAEGFIHTDINLVTTQWYHFGITYDGATKNWRIRVWDETASSVTESTGTGVEVMNIEDASFYMFTRADISAGLQGNLDEVAIFKDVLTADEIDEIRQGVYGASDEITIGPGAIDRPSTASGGWTYVCLDNPANTTGIISTIEVWANTNLTGFKIGTFFDYGTNDYECRDSITIGAVTSGSKQTFRGLSLEVEVGDLLGCYFDNGIIEHEADAASGVYIEAADKVTIGAQMLNPTLQAGDAVSIFGESVRIVHQWNDSFVVWKNSFVRWRGITAGQASGVYEFNASAAAKNYNLAKAVGSYEFSTTVVAKNYQLAKASGAYEFVTTSAGRIFCFASASGSYEFIATVVGKNLLLASAVGSYEFVAAVSAGNFQLASASGSYEFTSNVSAGVGILLMPPELHASIIDAYAGGAWLWLVRIKIPGYAYLRYAANTEDIVYGGPTYGKNNFKVGLAALIGDGSVPRTALVIAQDAGHILEDMVNATEGAGGGVVKIIRAHEDFLDKFIVELEQEVTVLTANSDVDNVTFQLGIPDPLSRKIPLRRYSSKRCPYALPSLFKGLECQYAGGDATCTGLYEDCFTKNNIEHWGGEAGLDPTVARV